MKAFLILLISFLPEFGQAQLYTDNSPINYYYKNIQFAKFPEPEINKQGVIFYECDSFYINSYIRNLFAVSFEIMKKEIGVFKFKRDRFRYTEYLYCVDNIEYSADTSSFLSFTDTVKLTITAVKNKRYWNWRRFRILLRPIERVTVFTGMSSGKNEFSSSQNAQFSYVRSIVTSNLSLSIDRFNTPFLITNIPNSEILNISANLTFNFNDKILQETEIIDKIDLSEIYIKPGKETSVLIYLKVTF